MAGPRQAAEVIIANGRKHLTQAEKEQRMASDAAARKKSEGESDKFQAPDWLPKELRKEYAWYRKALTERGLIAQIDRDVLGFYLVARTEYTNAGKRASAAIAAGDVDGARDWSSIQERYFKQARACANDMGLTITSRCRLVLPPKEEEQEDEFTAFLNRRRAAAGEE